MAANHRNHILDVHFLRLDDLHRNRSADALPRLAKLADEYAIPFEAVTPDAMTQADVIITITSSHQPLLMADHVSPGTHLVCMGTD